MSDLNANTKQATKELYSHIWNMCTTRLMIKGAQNANTKRAKTNLIWHIRYVHSNTNDNEWPNCEYKTINKGRLRAHIKAVHQTIKDNKCPKCQNKVFIFLILSSGFGYLSGLEHSYNEPNVYVH